MKKIGWIALDIDGTITLDKYSVPKEVKSYLKKLSLEGWNIALATGRPFAFAQMALSEFDFPYLFLGQNGSVALEMPQKKLLFKAYIPATSLQVMEEAYRGMRSDFLIYAGYDQGDFCFWRKRRFTDEEVQYIMDLQKRQHEKWKEVDDFSSLPLDSFPLIKCFGAKGEMERVEQRLKHSQKFEVAKIRDPFVEGTFILLVTDIHTSKGKSLTKVIDLLGRGSHVIAAGDDENDVSLLEVADIKIAMAHAPPRLQEVAHFIAPPTSQLGIISALKLALGIARQ